MIAYAYDAEGRQAMRTFGANTTRYLHALGQEIAEYSGAAPGTLARRHVPGPGLDEPLATVTGSAASRARRYHHADAQGSIVARTDDTGAAPAAAERYTYTPWGQVGTGTGTSQDGFRWLGRRLESQIGLYDMRARTYLPWMGRFLQPDPIGTTGGINLYAYALNTPLNRADTSGLSSTIMALQGKGGISGPFSGGETTSDPNIELVQSDRGALPPAAQRTLDQARSMAQQGSSPNPPLSTPQVSNTRLQNIVNDLYKGTTNPNRAGTGTTADAIRQELATGEAVGGTFHTQKGIEYSRALENWLRANPAAPYRDRVVAQSLLDYLRSALGGSR